MQLSVGTKLRRHYCSVKTKTPKYIARLLMFTILNNATVHKPNKAYTLYEYRLNSFLVTQPLV